MMVRTFRATKRLMTQSFRKTLLIYIVVARRAPITWPLTGRTSAGPPRSCAAACPPLAAKI